MQKPVGRSKVRRFAGFYYHVLRKRVQWFFGTYAKSRDLSPLPYVVASHQTPLRRRLKNVDMWMQDNKVVNLTLAIKKINGIVLRPGETMSYWNLIGNPTRRKGYVEGMLLRNGKVVPGIGGGLCQLSNLLFWITAHTPLTIVERWRHSYDVFPDHHRTQPFGSGATCSYPNIDLEIRNDTTIPFRLTVEIRGDQLFGSWEASEELFETIEIEERNHEIRHESWGGYTRHNRLVRVIHDKETGELLREEALVENHAIMMYEPMLS